MNKVIHDITRHICHAICVALLTYIKRSNESISVQCSLLPYVSLRVVVDLRVIMTQPSVFVVVDADTTL